MSVGGGKEGAENLESEPHTDRVQSILFIGATHKICPVRASPNLGTFLKPK